MERVLKIIDSEPEEVVFNPDNAAHLLPLCSVYFDKMMLDEPEEDAFGAIKTLVTDGFNSEQIWAQINTQNKMLAEYYQDLARVDGLELPGVSESSGVSDSTSSDESVSTPSDESVSTPSDESGSSVDTFDDPIEVENLLDISSLKRGKEEYEENEFEFIENEENQKLLLSNYQQQMQEKIKEVEELERKLVERKDWSLRGEVTSKERPKSVSIFEKIPGLEFDRNINNHALDVENSIALSEKLEEIIISRIKKSLFDDVVPKPKATQKEWKETLDNEIVFEKSKKGLAEIYEDQFFENLTNAAKEKLKEKHERISKHLDSLMKRLDALSNYSHMSVRPNTDKEAEIVVETVAMHVEGVGSKTARETFVPKRNTLETREERTREENQRIRKRIKSKWKAQAGNTEKRVGKDEALLKRIMKDGSAKVGSIRVERGRE